MDLNKFEKSAERPGRHTGEWFVLPDEEGETGIIHLAGGRGSLEYTIRRLPSLQRHIYLDDFDLGWRRRTPVVVAGLLEKILEIMSRKKVDCAQFHALAHKQRLNDTYSRIAKEKMSSRAMTWLLECFGPIQGDALRSYTMTYKEMEKLRQDLLLRASLKKSTGHSQV